MAAIGLALVLTEQWYIKQDARYATKAVQIMDAWSAAICDQLRNVYLPEVVNGYATSNGNWDSR